MKKLLFVSFIVLSLAALTVAAPPRAYLVERSEAVKTLKGANPALSLTLFTEGRETRGMIALQIDGELNPEKIRSALILSLGIVLPQPEVKDCRLFSFRGEECSGDARGHRQ